MSKQLKWQLRRVITPDFFFSACSSPVLLFHKPEEALLREEATPPAMLHRGPPEPTHEHNTGGAPDLAHPLYYSFMCRETGGFGETTKTYDAKLFY